MDKRVVVYIEKISRNKGYIVLDFPVDRGKINYYENFLLASGAEPKNKSVSIIELNKVKFEKYGTPREGLYYIMPDKLITQIRWNQDNINNEEETPYIAFKVSAEDIGPLNFGNALKYSQFVHDTDSDRPNNLEDLRERFKNISEKSKTIQFIVRNIGQGSMNEIHFAPESFILFDIGAKRISDLKPRIDEIRTMYQRFRVINKVLEQSPEDSFRAFILSHWDIDHYNGLLYLKDEDLDEFDLFVVPQRLPTKTSKKAFDRIVILNILPVPMRNRHNNTSATQFEIIFQNDFLTLYRGSKHYNRNKSGLTITIHMNKSDVLMPGDSSYHQIDDYMLTNCNKKQLYAVIPHHGGNAGDANRITGWNRLSEVAISVGENPWNHPRKDVLNAIEQQIELENIHITIENGDYIKLI